MLWIGEKLNEPFREIIAEVVRVDLFEGLAHRCVVGLFWSSADYLWYPTLVYIAKGEWRKLASEVFKPGALGSTPWVEAALQGGSLGVFTQLDESIGGDVLQIVEMAAVACCEGEVAAFVHEVGLSDNITPAPRSGLWVRS